jgi:hypothetical protein
MAGTVLLLIGFPLLILGVLRALQEELGTTHLSGNLSWVPYLAVIVGDALVCALLARAIMGEKRRADREREALRNRGG